MAIRLKAPFETGVASTGHRVEGGMCIVDTAEQAAYMAGPPFRFQILGEVTDADDQTEAKEEAPGEEAPAEVSGQPEPKRRRR